jgi:nucleoside 2-deoxyribosyltransferase
MRVYLSGSMQNRFAQEVQAERREASEALSKIGVFAVDPALAESQLWGKHLKAKISTSFRYKVIESMVKNDLYLIRRCDLLLVLTGSTPSDGTWIEWVMAKAMGIPVVMISPERCKKKNPLVGWSNVIIENGNIVPSLQAAISLIKRKYVKDEQSRKSYFNAAIRKAKYDVPRKIHKKDK